jgi:hypothetical protein
MATQSEINASLGLPPGINPDGSWNAQDYMERRVAGQVDTQAQVDAANAANPYSAQNMAKVDITRPGAYVTDPSTGEYVALTPGTAGYNINNPMALQSYGELATRGTADSSLQAFNAIATPAQKAEADRLWSIEKARLEEIDRQNALKAQQDQGKTMASATTANPSALPKGFLESLTAIPNVTDQQIVSAMKTANVSPKNLADGLGISEGEVIARVAGSVPNGQTVQLGDTIIQPKYRIIGDGQDQQIGGLENVYTYRASDNKVGGGYTQYAADGTLERTGTQMKVNATQDFLKFALGATALFGGAALAGLGPSLQAAGLTAAEAAGLGLTATEAASLGFTSAQLTAAGFTAADLAAAGLTATGTGAGLLTTGGTAAGTTTLGGATTLGAGAATVGGSSLVNSLLGGAGSALTSSLLGGGTGTNLGNILSGGLTTAGGLLQQKTSRDAAIAAQKMIETETEAAKTAAAFRPVGMTTRFGTSKFGVDPVTGLPTASYALSDEAKAIQKRLDVLQEAGLKQAEGAQEAFKPLQTGATSLFTLGNKYLAQTPEAVAKDYLASQMALLKPGRELELANLQNKLQQQGRGGLAVAQGGTLGDTTPELQALYNARAQQEAILAANAQQAGQQQVLYGAGLLGQGSQAMGQYYTGQQAAYTPYSTALGQIQGLEQLGQQPFTMGTALGQQYAQAGFNVGQLGLKGAGQSVALSTGQAATTNPYSTVLSGLGASSALGQGLGGLLGGGLQSAFSQTGVGSSGFGTGLAYGNQDLGLFL